MDVVWARERQFFAVPLLVLIALALALLVPQTASAALSSIPDDTGAIANSDVLDIAVAPNGDTYLAGEFGTVGPRTGTGLAFDLTTGALEGGLPEFGPGNVDVAIPDGSGGFYIGGGFTRIDATERRSLAHLLSDGTIDPGFPEASASVRDMALDGSTLYVVGDFTEIGGLARSFAAAIDLTDNSIKAWDPDANNGINSIDLDGGNAYLGGSFKQIGGETRLRLARVDMTTGAVDTGWTPAGTDGNVNAVEVTGSGVYAGGDFNNAGGLARADLAAFDTSTGAVIAGIDPSPSLFVNDLLLKDGKLFVAGLFTTIGGASRQRIARLDPATGAADSWDAGAVSAGVESIFDAGDTLFIGGDFSSVNGVSRRRAAEVSPSTGLVTSWNPGGFVNSGFHTVAVSGSRVFAGGDFNTINASFNSKIAKLNPDGSVDESWDPFVVPFGDTFAVDVSPDGNTLYIGGDFAKIHEASGSVVDRDNAAAIDISTGNLTAWDPSPDGFVTSIEAESGSVFVEGEFATIGGAARDQVAALDPGGTGTAQSWDPALARSGGAVDVSSIESDGSSVFIAGNFDEVGGEARGRLVEVDATTAVPTSFDPMPNGSVQSMELFGSNLFIGGGFSSVGGTPRALLAKITTGGAGTLTPWNPGLVGLAINDLAVADDGSSVFIGGNFSTGSPSRRNLAEIDATTGAYSDWNPVIYEFDEIYAVAEGGGSVKIGGEFDHVGPIAAEHYAQFSGPAVAPTNTTSPGITGTEEVGETLQASQGSWGGTPPITYAYAWRRCDAAGASCTAIGGATSSAYTAVGADQGKTLRVEVTATNAQGSDSATSAPTGVIDPAATPDPACSDGVDNDGDGKIDFPADPGCTGASDDSEVDPVTPPDTKACDDATAALATVQVATKRAQVRVRRAKKQVRTTNRKLKKANRKAKRKSGKAKKRARKQVRRLIRVKRRLRRRLTKLTRKLRGARAARARAAAAKAAACATIPPTQ